MNGNFPFDGSNVKEVANKIRTVNLEFTSGDWSFVSNEAKSLVSNLLTRNKVERLTAQEALESRWIQLHANHKVSSTHAINNSSLKENVSNRNETYSHDDGETEELTETYVNKRIANLTKRSKMEKILKNFLADSLTIELQEKFLQKCIDFDEDKGSSGYIKDKEFGFLARDFYEENIESINSGQKFGNNDSFCIRKRSEMLKIFNKWDRLCCGQDKQSSVSHRFIDYFQFLNDCEGK